MNSLSLILTLIGVCAFAIILLVMSKPLKFVMKFILNVTLGTGGIYAFNALVSSLGFYIGTNFLTLSFIGIMGVPGFVAVTIIGSIL